MKIVSKYSLIWALFQLICSVEVVGAEELSDETVVRVLEVSGTLRTATTLKGGDPVPEVFVTLYRIDAKAKIEKTSMKAMLEKVDGTFHQEDPLPRTPDVRLIIEIMEDQGIMFAINKNGEIKYRGVRKFANGLFEYENREGSSGSFVNKDLASQIIAQVGKIEP